MRFGVSGHGCEPSLLDDVALYTEVSFEQASLAASGCFVTRDAERSEALRSRLTFRHLLVVWPGPPQPGKSDDHHPHWRTAPQTAGLIRTWHA
jgi:hypothetical protein